MEPHPEKITHIYSVYGNYQCFLEEGDDEIYKVYNTGFGERLFFKRDRAIEYLRQLYTNYNPDKTRSAFMIFPESDSNSDIKPVFTVIDNPNSKWMSLETTFWLQKLPVE
jgi:hypothetical protein